MTQHSLSLAPFYKGWDVYQQHLITAIAPLSAEQLALRAAPHMWSVGMIATHIVATRVGWFQQWMGEGNEKLAPLAIWDEQEDVIRTAPELVTGLEDTWQMIQTSLARWTPDDLEQVFQRSFPSDEAGQEHNVRRHSRQWIIWHLLEHDLHHGGELSLVLGMYGLPALDL